jgi:predicted RNA-binding Zn ribbon-like protein
MASQQIGALTLPLAVAGHPALELCNTLAGWDQAAPKDYLRTYDHLLVWAGALGLVEPADVRRVTRLAAADPDAAGDVLARARSLRADLYRALTEARPPRGTLDRLGAQMQDAAASLRVTHSPGSGLSVRPVGRDLDLPLHAFADAARRLIDDGLAADVGRCPGEGCGWLFLRNGRGRRWCIMALCGNRAKARRFAERRRAATATRATA